MVLALIYSFAWRLQGPHCPLVRLPVCGLQLPVLLMIWVQMCDGAEERMGCSVTGKCISAFVRLLCQESMMSSHLVL
jgi:hypothetical protein